MRVPTIKEVTGRCYHCRAYESYIETIDGLSCVLCGATVIKESPLSFNPHSFAKHWSPNLKKGGLLSKL